jgi:hypothetical protein
MRQLVSDCDHARGSQDTGLSLRPRDKNQYPSALLNLFCHSNSMALELEEVWPILLGYYSS